MIAHYEHDEEAPVAPAPAARGRSANDAADPYTKYLQPGIMAKRKPSLDSKVAAANEHTAWSRQ